MLAPQKLKLATFLIVLAAVALIFTLHSISPLPTPWLWIVIIAICWASAAIIMGLIRRTYLNDFALIRNALKRFQNGDLQARIPFLDWDEYNQFADSFNLSADALTARLKILTDQVNEREAVFRCMSEGVIAITKAETIITINRAALKLINPELSDACGRNMQEVIRDSLLDDFIRRTLNSPELLEEQIKLNRPDARVVQLHGMRLTSHDGIELGAVIVLSDITNLHALEVMRRDFVANVSHELRTPITSMKGFLETLLDGNPHSVEDRARFLQIVARQVERLGAIVEDMLALSDIEHRQGTRELSTKSSSLRPILDCAKELMELRAKSKGVSIAINCPESLTLDINPALVEQAVANLLSNAVEYSQEGQSVEITASSHQSEVVISVIDHGVGIESTHLPRIFERFYRVEKGRSRKSGGTGLGLSIVKHIAQAHGGKVSVESSVGSGSVFRLHLPLSQSTLALHTSPTSTN